MVATLANKHYEQYSMHEYGTIDQVCKDIYHTVNFSNGLTLADIEKAVIIETLRRESNNRTRAARALGIGIRTLQRKIKQYSSETNSNL